MRENLKIANRESGGTGIWLPWIHHNLPREDNNPTREQIAAVLQAAIKRAGAEP